MYSCPKCEKESETRAGHAGHVGSHARKGSKVKNAVLYCIFQCELTTCGEYFNVARTVAKRKEQPRFCSRGCFNENRKIESKKKPFRWKDGTVSDKTIQEIEELKDTITECQICGMAEVSVYPLALVAGRPSKLAADHNHETGNFRGLLCVKCNIQLGWFEKYRDEVLAYLAADGTVSSTIVEENSSR